MRPTTLCKAYFLFYTKKKTLFYVPFFQCVIKEQEKKINLFIFKRRFSVS